MCTQEKGGRILLTTNRWMDSIFFRKLGYSQYPILCRAFLAFPPLRPTKKLLPPFDLEFLLYHIRVAHHSYHIFWQYITVREMHKYELKLDLFPVYTALRARVVIRFQSSKPLLPYSGPNIYSDPPIIHFNILWHFWNVLHFSYRCNSFFFSYVYFMSH